MVHLELESPDEVISLDAIFQTAQGVQAISGATGLGLPPVATQYTTGAGMGSTFRYARIGARDIDLPLYISGDNRAELKELVSKVAIALNQECILRFVDDDSSWVLSVRRQGGGTYTYGEDTTGERDLFTVITLRAGDPLWREETTASYTLSAPEGGLVTLSNAGDAPTSPLVTLSGPGRDFTAISPSGERLNWQGAIGPDEQIILDFETGTVVDNLGRNRYAELDTAPKFWRLPPGDTDVVLAWDNTSALFNTHFGNPKYNHIPNPTFHLDSATWTRRDITLFGSTSLTAVDITTLPSTNSPQGSMRVYFKGKGRVIEHYTTLTDLVVGETYRVGGVLVWNTSSGSKKNLPPYLRINDKKVSMTPLSKNDIPQYVTMTFVADATTAVMAFGSGSYKSGSGSNITWIQKLFVTEGDDGTYFTGDFTDVALTFDYGWVGTAHASKSQRLVPDGEVVDISDTGIRVEWVPRKWAMV